MKVFFTNCLLFLHLVLTPSAQELVTTSPDDDIEALSGGGGKWSVKSDTFIQWKQVESSSEAMSMEFTLHGPAFGYISMSISKDNTMGNDDTYICSQTTGAVKITSAHLIGLSPPIIDEVITEAPGSEGNLEDAFITCKFNRLFSVTKSVSGKPMTWNLGTTTYNLLYAEGLLSQENTITYHSYRSATSSRFNLASNAGYRQPSPPEPRISSMAVNNADNIFSQPGGDGGIWFVSNSRPGCGTASCKTVHWRMVAGAGGERMILFTVVGNELGWVGIAISRDMHMGDDDAYICSRAFPQSTNVKMTSAVLSGRAPPTGNELIDEDRVLLSAIESGTLVCSFLRPVSVTKTVNGQPMTWDLSQENFNLLFAEGSVSSSGAIQIHNLRSSTSGRFNFLNSAGYKTLQVSPIDSVPATEPVPLSQSNMERTSSGGLVWNFPTDCQEGSVPCRSLSFEPVLVDGVEMVRVIISGSGLWSYVGVLFSNNGMSRAGECYFCIRETIIGDEVRQAHIVSSVCGNPDAAAFETIPMERIIRIDETQENLSCTFLRPVAVTKTVAGEPVEFDLSLSKYSLIYGEGRLREDGTVDTPQYTAVSPIPLLLIENPTFTDQTASEITSPIDDGMDEATTKPSKIPETDSEKEEMKEGKEMKEVSPAQNFSPQPLQMQYPVTQEPIPPGKTPPTFEPNRTSVIVQGGNREGDRNHYGMNLGNDSTNPPNSIPITTTGSDGNLISTNILVLLLASLIAFSKII